MNKDKYDVMYSYIMGAFFILIVVCLIDVLTLWDLRNKYDDLKATCPVYKGMQLNKPNNFTYGMVVETCNGTVTNATPAFNWSNVKGLNHG